MLVEFAEAPINPWMALGSPVRSSSLVRKPLDIMKWGRLVFISPVTSTEDVMEVNLDRS